MKTKRTKLLLGALLALGLAAPAAAQVVEYDAGLRWDPNYFGPQKQSTVPADKGYHEASEPGAHIAADAPRPVYKAGEATAKVPCELMAEMHVGV